MVLASDEEFTVFKGMNGSMSYDIHGLTRFEMTAGATAKFARLKVFNKVTEQEIAELFCSQDEELEQVKE